MTMTINKTMTIGEVLRIHRGTARILMEFGMHCLGCPASAAESLEEACAVHGSNVDELVDQLNAYLEEQKA
jgi:hybrid cluster-associated redox disulfide protein